MLIGTVIYKNVDTSLSEEEKIAGEEMIVSRYGDKINVPHSAVPYVSEIIKALRSVVAQT